MGLRQVVTEPIRYGFAVGRVRVLEGRMLSGATYERLLDAPSFAEQIRVLSDTPYGTFLEGASTVEDVERAFDQALGELYRFLESANLPGPVIAFFRTPYDYANLKARLKADLYGQSVDGLLVDLGAVPAEVFAGPIGSLPKRFRAIAERAGDAGAADEESVSLEVDRALHAESLAHAAASRSRFLEGLAALQVDLANVRTLLRARVRERKNADARAMLIEGGTLGADALMRLYRLPVPELAGALASGPGPLRGVDPDELADLARFDVIADDVQVRYLKRARRAAAGPEPVIGYVMARKAEVMMVRTLLIGMLSGVPEAVLRRRLRERYE